MIHLAGVLFAGVQICTRCGDVLTDYRGAMVPEGQEALAGWAIGAFVETGGTNPKWQSLTSDQPTCQTITADAMAIKLLTVRNEWKT